MSDYKITRVERANNPKSITEDHKSYAYWTKGKQAPATRTIWTETVMFHVTGTQQDKDFNDLDRALKLIECGREVTAYYNRDGYILLRNISLQTAINGQYNGMVPTVTEKHIATVKRNCKDYDKLIRRIKNAMINNNKQGQTNTF